MSTGFSRDFSRPLDALPICRQDSPFWSRSPSSNEALRILDKQSEPEKGFRYDQILSSVTKLKAYLERATGLKGHKNAMCALLFIVDNSASPMETVLCLVLTLPYRLGGYGFSRPQLNCRIRPEIDSPKTRSRTRAGLPRSYYADLYWADEQIDVERLKCDSPKFTARNLALRARLLPKIAADQ